MRVLHLSTALTGGAGRAVMPLVNALEQTGVANQVLCLEPGRRGQWPKWSQSPFSKISRRWRRFQSERQQQLLQKGTQGDPRLFHGDRVYPRIAEILDALDAPCDIIHLHWIVGLIDPVELLRWSRSRAVGVVWTFRDFHPLTGGCHYPLDCQQYRVDCSECPAACDGRTRAAIAAQFERRKQAIKDNGKSLSVVAMTRAMTTVVRHSPLYQQTHVSTISNAIDPIFFTDVSEGSSRELRQGLTIGFIAAGGNDYWKGFDRFREVAIRFPEHRWHCAGTIDAERWRGTPIQAKGRLDNNSAICDFYDNLDVLIFPSRQESWGKVVVEAMSRGCVVIAPAGVGNVDEVLRDGENGFVVQGDFVAGAGRCLERLANLAHEQVRALRSQAMADARRDYHPAVAAAAYASLYGELRDRIQRPSP